MESIFFAKQRLITHTSFVYKTSRLVRISLLINAVNKRVLPFFSGKLFYKSKQIYLHIYQILDIACEQQTHFRSSLLSPEKYFCVCYSQAKLDRALELISKWLFLKSPTLLKAIWVMNQTLEGYTLRFWKNIFRPKYIDFVQSVQSYGIYRYLATSGLNTSLLANTAVDSVLSK